MQRSPLFRRLIAIWLGGLLLAACTRFFGTPPAPAPLLPQSTPAPFPTAPIPNPTNTASSHSLLPEVPRATVSEIVNTVEISEAEDSPFQPAQEGSIVGVGGQIRTGAESRVRLDLNETTIVRLEAETTFTIEALASDGSLPLSLTRLDAGSMWVGITGGTLQTLTPIGVISLQGSYAIFNFEAGAADDPGDDTLTVDCFDGPCTVQTIDATESAGRLERLSLSEGGGKVTREPLTDADVQSFIAFNPEASAPLLAALLEPSPTPSEATPTPIEPTPEVTLVIIQTSTATPTPIPTLNVTPGSVLGKHIVRAGESLYCIGRAYAVLPDAIARANGITVRTTILVGRELIIPAVQWRNPGTGPTCVAQFASPYVSGATATP